MMPDEAVQLGARFIGSHPWRESGSVRLQWGAWAVYGTAQSILVLPAWVAAPLTAPSWVRSLSRAHRHPVSRGRLVRFCAAGSEPVMHDFPITMGNGGGLPVRSAWLGGYPVNLILLAHALRFLDGPICVSSIRLPGPGRAVTERIFGLWGANYRAAYVGGMLRSDPRARRFAVGGRR